jgi:hypothetical protein
VRKELELARLEMSAIAADATRQVIWIAAGAVLGVIALVGLLATLVLALVGSGMSPALATLLVSVATLIVSAGLVLLGLSALRRIQFVPMGTVETLRQTPLWIRRPVWAHRKDHSHG